jgi:hypothetical protein
MIAHGFRFESGGGGFKLPTPDQFVMIRVKRFEGVSAPHKTLAPVQVVSRTLAVPT